MNDVQPQMVSGNIPEFDVISTQKKTVKEDAYSARMKGKAEQGTVFLVLDLQNPSRNSWQRRSGCFSIQHRLQPIKLFKPLIIVVYSSTLPVSAYRRFNGYFFFYCSVQVVNLKMLVWLSSKEKKKATQLACTCLHSQLKGTLLL